jgi:hypothetical protein
VAVWATINEARDAHLRGKRQIVAAFFVGNSQVATRFAPFDAVRQDAATTSAELREQMREFVPKRSIDFAGMIAQSWV